jgi:hypothetical protein
MPTSIAGFSGLAAAAALLIGGFSAPAQAQVGSTYKLVAFTGEASPDGGTYYTFGNPTIGADGSVGFVDNDSRGDRSISKVFAGQPGSLRLVVSSGDKVPGINLGSFSDFQSVSVSKDGRVAINAGVNNDGYFTGIWAETSDGLVLAGYEGSFDPSISALGPVAFRSGAISAKGQSTPPENQSTDALFVGAAGSPLSTALTSGQIIGGQRLQTIYDTSDESNSVGPFVDANESGAVAFKAVASPSASPAPKKVIYAGSPTAPSPVATQGDAAPGLDGVEYADPSTQPSIAPNGLVAFSSTLNSETGPDSAVFSGAPGAISAVAVQGTTVPTTTNVTFGRLSNAVVNSTGDVIFRATIQYPNETSRTGIWLQRKTGPAVLIAVSGISLPTPTGLREVTSVDFAGPGTFNDLHEFVFKASFGDDDQEEGIYVADTRPGAPIVHIALPARPRDRVTTKSNILVAGSATDDTGIEKVEYTVTREVSASKRNAHKRGKRFVTTRPKIAKGSESWNFQIPLSMGLNLISITATDKLGNVSPPYQVRVLRYERGAK